MTKKNYRDYPESYFDIVERFGKNGEDMVLEDTYAAVSYVRHDLHRFFKALSLAAEGDPYAANLSNIIRDINLIIEPPHAKREDQAKLVVKVNPMTKALLKHKPGAQI